MTDFTSLQLKVNDLKAKVTQNSITPAYLGALLDDFIAAMKSIDMTDLSEDVQIAVRNASSALSTAQTSLYKAAEALEKTQLALTLISNIESSVGVPGGIVPLDSDGLIPERYIPARDIRPQIVMFDGFTDFDGELPTMSSSARDGMVLFATRLRRFVYQVQSGSGLSVKTEYFNWWPSAEDYIAEASSGRPRSGCIFILRDSFTPYVASGTSLAELSHSGSGVVLDFYEDDDFSSRAYSHLADGLSKLRVDCSGATTSESAAGEPEEVLFTPDDCIVFDRASTRFVHRRITRGELPGVYPPTVGIVQVEFRNRWIGCEIWGAQGTHGALPADRVYYCSRTNQIYIYHRNYGYATHSFEPVASSVLTGTTLTEEEVRDMVAEIFSQQTPELPAGSILMSADEARQIVDSIFI